MGDVGTLIFTHPPWVQSQLMMTRPPSLETNTTSDDPTTVPGHRRTTDDPPTLRGGPLMYFPSHHFLDPRNPVSNSPPIGEKDCIT